MQYPYRFGIGSFNCTKLHNETTNCTGGIDHGESSGILVLVIFLLVLIAPAIEATCFEGNEDTTSSATDGDRVVLEKEGEGDDEGPYGDDSDEETPTCPVNRK